MDVLLDGGPDVMIGVDGSGVVVLLGSLYNISQFKESLNKNR